MDTGLSLDRSGSVGLSNFEIIKRMEIDSKYVPYPFSRTKTNKVKFTAAPNYESTLLPINMNTRPLPFLVTRGGNGQINSFAVSR